jgi:Protein of unknown function (DUF2934)
MLLPPQLWRGFSLVGRLSRFGTDIAGRAKKSLGAVMRRAGRFAKQSSPCHCAYAKFYPSLIKLRDQERSIISPEEQSRMDKSLENRIRERAYEIWTQHGCVEGQAQQHWLAAERELLAASTAVLAGTPNPKKKPPSSARSKAARTLARAG